tara:strand:+ start:12913 stop:13071 length:159 start_codon:yes stop_codon:yes gene_type:complete
MMPVKIGWVGEKTRPKNIFSLYFEQFLREKVNLIFNQFRVLKRLISAAYRVK